MEESVKVFTKIYNDILIDKFPDCYLYNQEGDINIFNTLEKKSKLKTIDGGKIKKITPNYGGSFTYDSKNFMLIKDRCLSIGFHSSSDNSGKDFLDYINSVLNADPNIFVRTKGLLVQDIRKYILETRRIQINNTEIDKLLINSISKYFQNLETIELVYCKIKKECNFNIIKADIELRSSVIENIQSFSEFNGNLTMYKTNISAITPSNIYSKKIKLHNIKNDNKSLKTLFLKCNFPYLNELSVSPETTFNGYSFEDSFKYLPDSAPMLENLNIEGKVRSLDFLTKFKHLIDCGILSLYDEYDFFAPYITNGKERKKIQDRNRLQIEIQKIIHPNDDIKYIETNTEFKRILKLIRFNQLISYSNEEKEFLLNNKNIINYFINNKNENNIEYYYETYFDKLHLTKTDSDLDTIFCGGHKIKITNNMLYYYYNGLNENENIDKIVQAKSFIYYIDGKPIIFEKRYNRGRSIDTIEAAKEYVSKLVPSTYNSDLYNYNKFIEILSELKENGESISIGQLEDALIEESCYGLNPPLEFMKLGTSGKQISYLYDYYNRLDQRYKYLEQKERKYNKLLNDLLIDNYDNFSLEDKKYLFINWSNFDYKLSHDICYLKSLSIDMEFNESLIDVIDNKTNGLYKKYISILNLINFQKHVLGYPYEVEIDKELIKKLSLKK